MTTEDVNFRLSTDFNIETDFNLHPKRELIHVSISKSETNVTVRKMTNKRCKPCFNSETTNFRRFYTQEQFKALCPIPVVGNKTARLAIFSGLVLKAQHATEFMIYTANGEWVSRFGQNGFVKIYHSRPFFLM